ncbi:hypothetical protein [Lentzea nigeriaca]|uniref:hypothetical protein n=1 Tax=Lentzea nigeriaca TaxID=1128665 RepID=UPI00195C2985|nr:hypothetical protein [Lentzea nigeriaca]MBM7857093.1 hypothetical protein [Lentzea nigeriaca]
MGYEYDVFLSYTRQGGGDVWVREHFYRALREWNAVARAGSRLLRRQLDALEPK